MSENKLNVIKYYGMSLKCFDIIDFSRTAIIEFIDCDDKIILNNCQGASISYDIPNQDYDNVVLNYFSIDKMIGLTYTTVGITGKTARIVCSDVTIEEG